MLTTTIKFRMAGLRVALAAVRLPLQIASACTWHLEAWRSRLQTAVDSLRNSHE